MADLVMVIEDEKEIRDLVRELMFYDAVISKTVP
mgnify:CR=1 FL=1